MTRILSIDGGGIRGIIPATVLSEIERRTGRRIADLFEVIAGTSTGGILACGLTVADPTGRPMRTAAELAHMYVEEGPRIFPHEFLGRIRSLIDEKYPQKGIETVLRTYMGDAMLSDTLTEIVVTAYDIERRRPFFFRSLRARRDAGYDFPLWMVARATSAAPSYFEPFLLPAQPPDGHYALVDGGVFANNPAMCAYVDADAGRARRDDVLMVSLGTGSLTRPLPYEKVKDWGLLQWTRPILDVVFDGVSDATDYQLLQILGPENHHRLQVDLDVASDALDDVDPENLHNLVLEGDRLVRDRSDEIDRICARLLAEE
ncbi:MAG TPA: patatin-like phospholipase family protein [Candidatus Dormibacteraeota bacterium]